MDTLVTGATGLLGRLVVASLEGAGHRVRRMSSRPGANTVHGDMATGEGLASALEGVEAVVHAASDPRGDPWQVDVAGSRRLTEAVDRRTLRHLVYVSIVGVDRNPYSYYRAKFAAEQVLLASGVPVTVLRVTQFHEFVDDMLQTGRRGAVLAVPSGWQLQPVAVREAAHHVCAVLDGQAAAKQVREFAGPEQLDSVDMARQWARAQRTPPRVVPVPVPGKIGKAFRGGCALTAGGDRGAVTYAEHLGAVHR